MGCSKVSAQKTVKDLVKASLGDLARFGKSPGRTRFALGQNVSCVVTVMFFEVKK